MVSFEQLLELNKKGDLSGMLAKKFDGERGYMRDVGDMEVMIGFKSRADTPSAVQIGNAVVEHYSKLGYNLEPKWPGADMFEAFIFPESKGKGCISLTISTFYPLSLNPEDNDENNHVRITTEVCA